MFVTEGESNYDRVCADLLAMVRETGASANAASLDGSAGDGGALIPLFGRPCLVRPDGVYRDGRRLDTIGSILIVRYLLQAGGRPVGHAWLPYRDLKDGAQFSSFIKANIEGKIARVFSGKRPLLAERLSALGGIPAQDVRADVALVLHPLPRVPVLCLFWDGDEEFPASFQFLFDGSAQSYLDLESLAVVLQYIYLNVMGEA